ncbi:hypothetical protein ABPG73_008538 [Tetrahymena malaccensis]
MDQKLENLNNYKSRKQSIFFKQAPLEDDRQLFEMSEAQDKRIGFQKNFYVRNSQPQKLHQGDQDVSYKSLQAGIHGFLQESENNMNSSSNNICKTQQEEVINISLQDYFNCQHKTIQSEPKSYRNDKEGIQTGVNINDFSQTSDLQELNGVREGQSSNKIQILNSKRLNRDEYAQSNCLLSKNTIIKSQIKNQSQNDSQSKSINQSRQKVNSHILIQDDIFYEKDLKKLGTKVNFAIQSQYQFQQDFQRTNTYKQNLQKAAKIVSRLLNSSMNRVMRIRQYVNQFITLLKLRNQNRKIEGLTHQELLVINDLSYFHKKSSKNNKSQRFFRVFLYLLKFAKFFPTFMPSNTIRVIWDVIQVGFTYVFLYIYSLLIFFDQNYFEPEFLQKFNQTIFTLFLVDNIVNLNTAFYDKDIIITKRILIAKKYFFSSIFVTDFISMFILGYKIINSSQLIFYDQKQHVLAYGFNILIFLKANGLSSKKKRFDYVFTLTENQKHICKLINQLSSVMTVAHLGNFIIVDYSFQIRFLAAIGWYFVGVQEANNDHNNWLQKIDILSNSKYEQYIYAIYWSITTMTTAQEQKDRDKNQEDKILSELSNKLRNEITLEINSKILNNYHLFSSNFSKSTLNKLIFIMKEILVNPNEIIISEDQQDDCSIYFIQNGVIEIYQQQIQKQGQISVVKTLTDGQIFGDISFFSGLQRQSSARSVNLSTLYKITRDEFIDILKENKEDFERFKMMEDQIIFQKEKSVIHNDCYYCKDSNHIANQCPRTHKLFDKQYLVLKNNFSMFQERSQNEKMNKNKKQNAKKIFKKIQDTIKFLKQNLEFDNGQSFFFFEENYISSNDSISQSEYDEEEDDNTQSDTPDNSLEKDKNQKKNIQGQEKERIDKSSKNILKSEKSYQTSNEETDIQQVNQENQIQKCHSNFVYENQDIQKAIQSNNDSQQRIKSSDATDSVDSINQEESSKKTLKRQKSQQESNALLSKKDAQYKTEMQQQSLIYQKEKEGSDLNNAKIQEQQRSHQNSMSSTNIQLADQQKNQIKKRSKKSANFISNQFQEDQFQNFHQESNQVQKSFKSESNKKASVIYHSSNSHKNSFSKSQKLLNQSQRESRYSIDQSIQNIAALMLLQNKNISSQQINSQSYCYQQNSNINIGSSFTIKERQEQSQISKNNSSRFSQNRSNQKENSQSKIQTQKPIELNKQQTLNNDQIIDRLSKILQNSQIPLLLQLTTGKSFQHLDSQFLTNPMDQFDKMQCFKKFYPDYNFDKVLQKLKSCKQEQKRLKKLKLATKERRQVIGLTKFSIFQANSNLIRFIPQDYDINLYKPTYLSYGTRMKKANIYPINNYFIQNN